ncbi:hypothetical protein NCS52_01584500 [Fusarium sp. LHS14.1]|nr:hypothetical protein NCS52_01584500 [Fusarium sp. LHS14.1]
MLEEPLIDLTSTTSQDVVAGDFGGENLNMEGHPNTNESDFHAGAEWRYLTQSMNSSGSSTVCNSPTWYKGFEPSQALPDNGGDLDDDRENAQGTESIDTDLK